MTLGGRNPVPSKAIDQLHELWYTLRGLEADFPTSAQLPSHESIAVNGGGIPDPSLLPFHFHIQAQPASTVVKAYFEVGDHAKSDIAAAKTLTGFLERRGRGGKTKDYLNAFQGLLSLKELHTRSGVQGYISVGFEKGELDITSYINPLAYRRFDEIKADLNKSTIVRQRRSRFE
jgi:DMATS type aromatic prenyltransferase